MSESDSSSALALIEPAATRVRDPISGKSIWLSKMIDSASMTEEKLTVNLQTQKNHTEPQIEKIKNLLAKHLREDGWPGDVLFTVKEATPAKTNRTKKPNPVKGMSGPGMQPHGGPISKLPIMGVKKIIAVASGKGGVGKSTVSVNLAIALTKMGHQVGLLDADVYGPSLPTMMRVSGQPLANDKRQIIPKESYGVKCISMGFMVDDKEPIIWRGPMVMGVVKQFFQQVAWGDLDFLIVDLPPGTGDAQLTMIQSVDIDGAIIVTTPQKVAVLDAVRGVEMFNKLDVPIVGIVENMSYLTLPNGDKLRPFGQGGGLETATAYNVPLIEQIPLNDAIRAGGDLGMPVALSEDTVANPFVNVAKALLAGLEWSA